MNRNKNLLIYYLWKKLSKFSDAQKKVFHAFSFQLCSTANSKCSFYISLCEIICIKIQTMSLVLTEILCVLFTLRHHFPATEKNFKPVELFFQSRERNKNTWFCATTDTKQYSEILRSRDFQSLNGDPP